MQHQQQWIESLFRHVIQNKFPLFTKMNQILILSLFVYISSQFCLKRSAWTTTDSHILTSLDISPNDQYFVTGHDFENGTGGVFLWNLSNMQMIDYYYSLKPINKVAFSNNGNYIAASCRNGSVLILDPFTLSIVKTLNTTKSSTNCIAFHKIDNSKLLVGGSDNILQIWAINTPTILQNISTSSSGFQSCDYSPTGSFIAITPTATLVFDDSGSQLFSYPFGGHQVAVKKSIDETFAVTGFGTDKAFYLADWLGTAYRYQFDQPFYSCDYSDDGTFFAVSSTQGIVFIYDAISYPMSYMETNVKRYSQQSYALKFTHDSKSYLVTDPHSGQINYFTINDDPAYFYSNCTEICGDSITWTLQCDNQLGRLLDGCDDLCNIMPNFDCYQERYTFKTFCSYNANISMELVSAYRDRQDNKFFLVLQISPPLYAFNLCGSSDLMQIFAINQTFFLQNITFDNSAYELTFIISNISTTPEQITIIYKPDQSYIPGFYLGGLLQYFNFTFQPEQTPLQQSLAYKKVSNTVTYWSYILVGTGWLAVLLGFVLKKLSGIEAMYIIQFSLLNVVLVGKNFISPFKYLTPLKFSFGYNHPFFYHSNIPIKLVSFPFLQQFGLNNILANNFNFFLAVMMIALILALVIRFINIISDFCQTKNTFQKKKQEKYPIGDDKFKCRFLYQHSLQLLMTFAILSLAYFSIISTLCFMSNTVLNNTPSLVVFSLAAVILLFNFLFFYFEPSSFAHFRQSFRPTKLATHHYFLYAIVLVVASLLMVFLEKYPWAPGIPIVLLFLETLVYRPYECLGENLRSAFNLLVIGCFVGLKTFIEMIQVDQAKIMLLCTLLIVHLGLLTIVLLFCFLSFVWAIYQWHSKRRIALNRRMQMKVLQDLTLTNVMKKMSKLQQQNIFTDMIDYDINLKKYSSYLQEEMRAKMNEKIKDYVSVTAENEPQIVSEEDKEKERERQELLYRSIIQQINVEQKLQKREKRLTSTDVTQSQGRCIESARGLVEEQHPQKPSSPKQRAYAAKNRNQDQKFTAKKMLIQQQNYINLRDVIEYTCKKMKKESNELFLQDYYQIKDQL